MTRLLARALTPLPLGAIRPAGWLRAQLETQASGLGGHLDTFWPDVAQSAWFGGNAEGWERAPYWLDGFIPLAVLLNDPALLARAERAVDAILTRQHADGWFGPLLDASDARRKTRDPWPIFVALKALTQWHEYTGDARIIPAMLRFCRLLETELVAQPLFDWGRYRWADLLVSLHWLHERTGDDWLLDLAALVQQQGFDWMAFAAGFPYTAKLTRDVIHPATTEPRVSFSLDMASHVVNCAMAIKSGGVWARQSHDPADAAASRILLEMLDRYHGQVNGMFSGDEHLAGLHPSQGTELCAVVEAMYSLEVLLSITGDARWAERLERIAFNALPATFTPDMWAHQYVQQCNQIRAAVVDDRIYTNNGPDANIFGLEPHYGCCTANMHQGWPKYAASLWMRADDGFAVLSYAPCELRSAIDGVPVTIRVATDYPFGETVRISVETESVATFAVHLAIPGWAHGASLTIGNLETDAPAGEFMQIVRTWQGTTAVLLVLPMPVVRVAHAAGVALQRGPLLYALPIAPRWRALRAWPGLASDPGDATFRGHDWAAEPASPWAYALELDSAAEVTNHAVNTPGFRSDGAPIVLHVRARRCQWPEAHAAASEPAAAVVDAAAPVETITLVPYGCTSLRIAVFPGAGGGDPVGPKHSLRLPAAAEMLRPYGGAPTRHMW